MGIFFRHSVGEGTHRMPITMNMKKTMTIEDQARTVLRAVLALNQTDGCACLLCSKPYPEFIDGEDLSAYDPMLDVMVFGSAEHDIAGINSLLKRSDDAVAALSAENEELKARIAELEAAALKAEKARAALAPRMFNSDIGTGSGIGSGWGAQINGKPVKQVPIQLLSADESGESVPPRVLEAARSRGARLIVRTFRYGNKPGAWYVKGDASIDYDAVEECVISNQAKKRFCRRRCWILPAYE